MKKKSLLLPLIFPLLISFTSCKATQVRRAAISIAANIAEGFRKHSKADKIRFYNIARGSVEECRYYLILTKDLEYGNTSEAKSLLEEVSKLLEAYSQSVSNSES